MSITKRNKIYHYSFTIKSGKRSFRFRGSTGTGSKALANEYERKQYDIEYKRLRLGHKQGITVNQALARYWTEYAKFLTSDMVRGQLRNMLRIFEQIKGPGVMLNEIADEDVQKYVNIRRDEFTRHPLRYKDDTAPDGFRIDWQHSKRKVSPRTINGELDTFNKMNNMAKKTWKLEGADADVKDFKQKIAKKIPCALTTDQVNNLLANANDEVKDLILFMLMTGVRLSNAIYLKGGNVDMQRRELKFQTKGGEVLVTAMNSWVYSWLKAKEPFGYNDRLLTTSKSMKKALTGAFDRAGIVRPLNKLSHIFRETFATMCRDNDVDIKLVQKLLGHSRVTTTEIYIGGANSDTRAAVEKVATQIGHKAIRGVK